MLVNALDVTDLSVSFGSQPVFSHVSFAVPLGQTVALLGDNGSGKSTLMKALLGLIDHQEGHIALLGTDLGRFRDWRSIGYVPQRATVSLHSTTVREVVASGVLANRAFGWPRASDKAAITAALEAVDMADHSRDLYSHLSGGQQQRVLIARGIVNSPRLILMDEPFAGVDLGAQHDIAHAVARLDATALIVLHETAAMEGLIERTLLLQDGHLIDTETGPQRHGGHHEVEPPPRTHLLSGLEPTWTS